MDTVYIHIGEMLARNGRMYPNDVALVERIPASGKRSQITWKEFDDRANKVSNMLFEKGIRKGDRVVHFMNNSIDWLAAYFGIVRTGAWVVPLNFRFTAEDVKYCADVAEPGLMVFDQEFAPRIDAVKNELPVRDYICVGSEPPAYAESFSALVDRAPASPLRTPITFDDPCGLYFTSGTTGQPKPILLTHRNMVCACITENVSHHQTKKDELHPYAPALPYRGEDALVRQSHSGWAGGNPQRDLARVGARSGERGRRDYSMAPRALGAGYI